MDVNSKEYEKLRIGRTGVSLAVIGVYITYTISGILVPEKDHGFMDKESFDGIFYHFF